MERREEFGHSKAAETCRRHTVPDTGPGSRLRIHWSHLYRIASFSFSLTSSRAGCIDSRQDDKIDWFLVGYDTSIFVLQKVLSEEIHSVHQKCLGPSGVSWSITSDCLVFGNPSTLRHQQPLSWSTMMVQQKSLSFSNLCHRTHSGLVSPLHGL